MLVNEYFDYSALWDEGLTSLEENSSGWNAG